MIIGTGYCGDKLELFDLWMKNTLKFGSIGKNQCTGIVVVNATGLVQPAIAKTEVEVINVQNLGHIGDMPKDQQLGGWSAGVILGAMYAYHCKEDFIYKEQDCLAFGPWVEKLYQEIGNHSMIIGRKNVGPGIGGYFGQSLFLIKWKFIPIFISAYLSLEESDATFLPEHKFAFLMEHMFPDVICVASFGYDRTRPFRMNDLVWYGQQWTPAELDEARKRGLI